MIASYADTTDVREASLAHSGAFHAYMCRLHQSMQERTTLSNALRQGKTLVDVTTLI
jgi:hypothetical protein